MTGVDVDHILLPTTEDLDSILYPLGLDLDSILVGSNSYLSETFRTHDCSSLLEHAAQFSSSNSYWSETFVDDEDKAEWRPLKPIPMTDKDQELPCFLRKAPYAVAAEFPLLLPRMAETFEKADAFKEEKENWSLFDAFRWMALLPGPKFNIQDALESELVAICVWFLFIDVPAHFKEGVASTLAFISFGTSKAIKLPIDQTCVENLVGRILTSGNTEVQRQVCLALFSLAEFRSRLLVTLEFTLCAGIQDQLLQFVCNVECNPVLIYPVLGAIASLSQFSKAMRKKFFETGSLRSWLVKLLSGKDDESIWASRRKDDESILACTYRIIACIVCECDGYLWGSVIETLSHHITSSLREKMTSFRPLTAFALAMPKITKYGSLDQIKDVVDVGGLKLLFFACSSDVYDELVIVSLKAIQSILRCLEANPEATQYYEMIQGDCEWEVITSIHRSRSHYSRINLITADLLDNYRMSDSD